MFLSDRMYHRKSSHHVVQIDEGVVDGHNLDLASCGGGTGHQTADTSESEIKEEAVSMEETDSAGSQRGRCVNTPFI